MKILCQYIFIPPPCPLTEVDTAPLPFHVFPSHTCPTRPSLWRVLFHRATRHHPPRPGPRQLHLDPSLTPLRSPACHCPPHCGQHPVASPAHPTSTAMAATNCSSRSMPTRPPIIFVHLFHNTEVDMLLSNLTALSFTSMTNLWRSILYDEEFF
jgi:hypothetical protein